MLIIAVRFVIKQDHVAAFSQRVRQQARDSLEREPGCRRFDVAGDAADPRRIFLYEIYDDAAAFDAHRATPHFESFSADVENWVESKMVERWDGPWT